MTRFIDAGVMDAPVAFGRMPVVANAVATSGADVLMTGVFGRAHFQIGWFEDVDAVLDLDAAGAEHVDVFRRPLWGGGTAFYDEKASALFAHFFPADRFATLDEALEHVRPSFEKALAAVGLGEARFEGSSDIRWQDRKLGTLITQSILGTVVVGGFLNLRKPDLDLYRRVAHVPEEKFADKAIKDMVEYICTARDVLGSDLSYETLRDALADGMTPGGFTPEEDANTQSFVQAVGAEDWIRRVSSKRFAEGASNVGFANYKARKLIRAGVALEEGLIAKAMIAGDMHVSPPDVMDRLGTALVGAELDRGEITRRAGEVLKDVEQPDRAAGITSEDVSEVVMKACAVARTAAEGIGSIP